VFPGCLFLMENVRFWGDRRENVLGALFGEVFWGVNFFHKGNVRGTVTA